MSKRFVYGVVSGFVTASVEGMIALLAAGVERRAVHEAFPSYVMAIAGAVVLIGILVGAWLGGEVTVAAPEQKVGGTVPADTATPWAARGVVTPVTMTRLRALLSVVKTRGKAIHLSDVFTFGSKIDIDTRERD